MTSARRRGCPTTYSSSSREDHIKLVQTMSELRVCTKAHKKKTESTVNETDKSANKDVTSVL